MTTWTPVESPSATWTTDAQAIIRVFSPYVFSLRPVFDTGTTQGIWLRQANAPASWTAEVAR